MKMGKTKGVGTHSIPTLHCVQYLELASRHCTGTAVGLDKIMSVVLLFTLTAVLGVDIQGDRDLWIPVEGQTQGSLGKLQGQQQHFSNSYFELLSLWVQLIKINKRICSDLDFRPSLNNIKAFLHRFTNHKVNNLKLARQTVNIVSAKQGSSEYRESNECTGIRILK